MPTRSSIFDESPSVDGPDYVALVIEWDELADDLERQLRAEPASLVAEPAQPSWPRALKLAVGVGAGLLAWRIVHRLRA
jgi:hypothetical protein